MRPLAILLSLILLLAPWSGAMAMAGSDTADAPAVSDPSSMPCHGQVAVVEAPCDDCLQADCNLLDCEHCASAVAGILPTTAISNTQPKLSTYPHHQAALICADLVPDCPPPIA